MKKFLFITLALLFTNISAFANPPKIDMAKWQYNSVENVFYQLGIPYCDNPADEKFEKIAIFVPAQYLNCSIIDDNTTYSCTINKSAKIRNYTPKTAPILMPVETAGYMSNPALTEYKSVWEYTNEGFIYIYAGCRGREHGVPAGVTDLKAAIKYIKYNKNIIPGDINRIFSFGMSDGGAQSILLGVSGDNKLYAPYLKQIGAVEGYSDNIYGSMAWCPITNLDSANEAYEWSMNSSRLSLDKDNQKISNKMAEQFAKYINEAKFRKSDGNLLELRSTNSGIYQGGSYYNYLEKLVNQSLTNFLADNLFPVDMNTYGKDEFSIPEKNQIQNQEEKIEQTEDQQVSDEQTTEQKNEIQEDKDNINNPQKEEETESGKQNLVFNSGKEYIEYLNSKKKWIEFDEKTYSVKIISLKDFIEVMKPATKPVGAFDGLEKQQGENILFGYSNGTSSHFDRNTEEILENTKYSKEFKEDFLKTDFVGNTVDTRMNMYNPLYYIMPYYSGYKTSKTAKFFRIRSGLSQSDTALTTEVNLALALKRYCGEKNVDFETVWAMKHVKAERRGTPEANLIKWVNKCITKSKKL